MDRQNRREFLQSVGVSVAPPMLGAFFPVGVQSATATANTQCLVCIGTYLGRYQRNFFPEQTGKNYGTRQRSQPTAAFVLVRARKPD